MNPTKSATKGNTWHEDQRRGKNAEAFFLCHSTELTGYAVLEPLKQIPHNEGDFLMTNGKIYEVKADSNGGYIHTGNICVQISNDSGTSTGFLHDMQDPEKQRVDFVTYILCSDYECMRPYAAITMPVKRLAAACGCPAGGCEGCGRCQPGTDGWQRAAFPDAKLSRNEAVLLLPLGDVLRNEDVGVTVFKNATTHTPTERWNYLQLVSAEKYGVS